MNISQVTKKYRLVDMNFVIGWNEPDIRIIKKEICNNFLAFYGSVRQNVVGG